MESDDGSVAGVPLDIVEDVLGRKATTIVAGHKVPHNNLVTKMAHGSILYGSHPSMRWAEELRLQDFIGTMAVVEVLPTAPTKTSNMIVGVVADGMTAPTHLFEKFRIAVSIVAHHKEGGLGSNLVEHVEHKRRGLGNRAVVESQINRLLATVHPPQSMRIEPSQEACGLFNQHQCSNT